MIVKRFLKDC